MSEPAFSDTVVYESALIRIGAFRCDRTYSGFRNTGWHKLIALCSRARLFRLSTGTRRPLSPA